MSFFETALCRNLPVSKFEAAAGHLPLATRSTTSAPTEMGCDYLTIPHNSNLSNGKMLSPYADMPDTPEAKIEYTNARLAREPLMESFSAQRQFRVRQWHSGHPWRAR